MIKCPKCGINLQDGAKYCEFCGPIIRNQVVKGEMHDSVAIRSPGAGSNYAPSVTTIIKNEEDKKYCSSCKTPISDKNRSIRCFECETFFCAACEGDFRDLRNRGEKPLCYICYKKQPPPIKKKRVNPNIEKSTNHNSCPFCNKPLNYVIQYRTWYCYNCKTYPYEIQNKKKGGIKGFVDSVIDKIDNL